MLFTREMVTAPDTQKAKKCRKGLGMKHVTAVMRNARTTKTQIYSITGMTMENVLAIDNLIKERIAMSCLAMGNSI